jgi:sulfatase maturation enzyme AslB (radical SAM superfamily)
MGNEFCRFLSNGYTFVKHSSGNVFVKPCCIFLGKIPLDKNLEKNRNATFNSINNWTSACDNCKKLEDAGQPSLRQSSFDIIPKNSKPNSVIAMDIKLDIHCNAACVICGPHASTLWQKESNKHDSVILKINSYLDDVQDDIDKITNLVSFEDLRYIKFFGGEPLLTDTHIRILEKISNPQNVTLQYTTNGSIYPSARVIELWSKFKLVLYYVSIDGVGERFNYLRWPLKWDKVSSNLIQFRKEAPNNILFRIEHTVNFLNGYYYNELESWVNTFLPDNRVGDATEITIHPCHATWQISNISTEVVKLIVEKYGHNHKIVDLIKQQQINQPTEQWKQFVKKWDPIRNNSWEHAFPEMVEYFK